MNLKVTAPALASALGVNVVIAKSSLTDGDTFTFQAREDLKAKKDLGSECDPTFHRKQVRPHKLESDTTSVEPDTGLLELGCAEKQVYCAADPSSSLGGRCKKRNNIGRKGVLFQNIQKKAKRLDIFESNRNLQIDGSAKCPSKCYAPLCECLEEYGDIYYCAEQLNTVCVDGMIGDCVDKNYIDYYEALYCPYAECRVDGISYVTCNCDFYVTFCRMYEEYREDYDYVDDNCRVAECCAKAKNTDARSGCFLTSPSAMPSTMYAPTNSPSNKPTNAPTMYPTDRSNHPSNVPSATPTSIPTENTNTPSEIPSEIPTANPSAGTNSPSEAPSAMPTSSPSVGTNSPSEVPSAMLSSSPSVGTSNPSEASSVMPTSSPSMLTNSPSQIPSRIFRASPSPTHTGMLSTSLPTKLLAKGATSPPSTDEVANQPVSQEVTFTPTFLTATSSPTKNPIDISSTTTSASMSSEPSAGVISTMSPTTLSFQLKTGPPSAKESAAPDPIELGPTPPPKNISKTGEPTISGSTTAPTASGTTASSTKSPSGDAVVTESQTPDEPSNGTLRSFPVLIIGFAWLLAAAQCFLLG